MEANNTNTTFCNQSTAEVVSGSCSSAAGATILSPSIMFLAGIFGNVLALFTLHRTRTDVRSTKFYTLVTGLAWTDLIGILLTSPSVLTAYVNGEWVGGDAHCRFHGFAMTCFGLATPLIISAMAVERFLALKCVFFYSSKCKNGTARGLVLVLWLMVILYGMLPLFGFGAFENQYPGTWCFLDFHSKEALLNVYAYIYASVNLLLIVIMLLCNGYVVARLFHTRFRRMSEGQSCGNITEKSEMLTTNRRVISKHQCMEGQMIALMFALTTVFVLCWAPLMLQIISTMATGRANYLLDLAAVRLASLNQTLDPWLYIIVRRSMITNIKKYIRRMLKRLGFMHKSNSENDDCVSIIGPGKESHSNNNNHKICQPNADMHRDNSLGKIFSRPDLMHDSNYGNRLQLPDVTNTGASGYVCRLHFGSRASEGEEEGIYVKISFLSHRSTDNNSHQRVVDDDCKCDVIRANSYPLNELPVLIRTSTLEQTDDTKTTDVITKDVTSNDAANPNLLYPHSEVIPDVVHDQTHKSLRKTRSTT